MPRCDNDVRDEGKTTGGEKIFDRRDHRGCFRHGRDAPAARLDAADHDGVIGPRLRFDQIAHFKAGLTQGVGGNAHSDAVTPAGNGGWRDGSFRSYVPS